LFKQTRFEFTPENARNRSHESVVNTNNDSNNINYKPQLKSEYDKDFRKLSNICETAIMKANEKSYSKKLSTLSDDNQSELRSLKSNSELGNNEKDKINLRDTPIIPQVSTLSDTKLNNQLLFDKLSELERKVVNTSAHNQYINQIK